MDAMTFGINIDYQMLTSTVVIGETFATPITYSYSSTAGFQASIGGVMITTYPSPSQILSSNSWIIDSKVAIIDSSMSSTIVPQSLYTFILNQVLVASIGYYYDKTLGSNVMSCN